MQTSLARHLQSKYRDFYTSAMAKVNDPAQAKQIAQAQLAEYILKESSDKTGLLWYDNRGLSGFGNWEKKFLAKGKALMGNDYSIAKIQQTNILNSVRERGLWGKNGVANTKDGIFSKAELEEIVKVYEETGKLPENVLFLNNLLKNDVLGAHRLINAQLKSQNMDTLKSRYISDDFINNVIRTDFNSSQARTALSNWVKDRNEYNQALVLHYSNPDAFPLPVRSEYNTAGNKEVEQNETLNELGVPDTTLDLPPLETKTKKEIREDLIKKGRELQLKEFDKQTVTPIKGQTLEDLGFDPEQYELVPIPPGDTMKIQRKTK